MPLRVLFAGTPEFSVPPLRALLARAGFTGGAVDVGRFELGLNLWARATRR